MARDSVWSAQLSGAFKASISKGPLAFFAALRDKLFWISRQGAKPQSLGMENAL
jgi:hypothetical protein